MLAPADGLQLRSIRMQEPDDRQNCTGWEILLFIPFAKKRCDHKVFLNSNRAHIPVTEKKPRCARMRVTIIP